MMKELGYGEDYRYAHDEPDAVALGERYFPDDMPEATYYHPVPRGLEIRSAKSWPTFVPGKQISRQDSR